MISISILVIYIFSINESLQCISELNNEIQAYTPCYREYMLNSNKEKLKYEKICILAESTGFEPVRPVKVRHVSSVMLSATQPTLLKLSH